MIEIIGRVLQLQSGAAAEAQHDVAPAHEQPLFEIVPHLHWLIVLGS